ncbi:hypothetical protein CHS0354_015214 [Potamilus streckersoni]|uniref:C-type lectin domain-containing protein n=1 Tax=Potamilus streckersoni TaxID=2493646 RepID=A0AAE0SD49_9BIVA|nr:hypothetical protein CHS0354_015214 [Potamilus streckersoni]
MGSRRLMAIPFVVSLVLMYTYGNNYKRIQGRNYYSYNMKHHRNAHSHRRPIKDVVTQLNKVLKVTKQIERCLEDFERSTCPEGYHMYTGSEGPFCYILRAEPCVNWDTAREFCKSEGGDLIVFNEENFEYFRRKILTVLTEQGASCISGHYWVGANDENSTGSFRFINGRPIPLTSGIFVQIASDVKVGECVKSNIVHQSYLSSSNCGDKASYICQIFLPK